MDHLIKFLVEVKAGEIMFKLCEKFGKVKTAVFMSVVITLPVTVWKLPDIILVLLK